MSDEHNSKKEKAALASIFASAGLTLGKLVAGLLSGSLALLSEALHGLLDTAATIVTYYAVRVSGKPADDEHHYGHGKVEAVAALAETALLAVLSAGVLYEAVHRLVRNEVHTVSVTWIVIAVLIVSIIVDGVRWRALSRVAKETRSDALAADALHFSSDLVSTVLVLAGLIAVHFGFKQGDTLAAIGVSLFIAIAGYRLGKRTIDTLVDAAPPGLAEKISAAVDAVPGVVHVESLRLRPAGAQIFGEASIAVARTLPAERMAGVREDVSRMLSEKFPDTEITVRATPRPLDNESVLERVILIASRRRLSVHHVTVQQVDDKISISLDIEVDGRMSLNAAHDVASSLEDAIEDELGQDVEVETHIEPMEVRQLSGEAADGALVQDIVQALERISIDTNAVQKIHDVRVRNTANGLIVNYHCFLDGGLDVENMHRGVDRIDQAIRKQFPQIIRVVGHAEPLPE